MATLAHIVESATRETLPLPMTAAVLCGGKSSRMGRAKAFLPYGGKTLIEHRLATIKDLFAEVVMVANEPESYSQLRVNVVKDIIPNRGPLVAILSALLVSQYEHTFVIACDMPLIDNRLIREMCQRRAGTDVLVLSHEDGIEPLLGIYSKRCVESLEQALFDDNLGTHDFLTGINASLFPLDPIRHCRSALPAYFNVDTPQDYSKLIRK